jgi:shikimate 5-dehydrogenase
MSPLPDIERLRAANEALVYGVSGAGGRCIGVVYYGRKTGGQAVVIVNRSD